MFGEPPAPAAQPDCPGDRCAIDQQAERDDGEEAGGRRMQQVDADPAAHCPAPMLVATIAVNAVPKPKAIGTRMYSSRAATP